MQVENLIDHPETQGMSSRELRDTNSSLLQEIDALGVIVGTDVAPMHVANFVSSQNYSRIEEFPEFKNPAYVRISCSDSSLSFLAVDAETTKTFLKIKIVNMAHIILVLSLPHAQKLYASKKGAYR